jgi:hypothetical protein
LPPNTLALPQRKKLLRRKSRGSRGRGDWRLITIDISIILSDGHQIRRLKVKKIFGLIIAVLAMVGCSTMGGGTKGNKFIGIWIGNSRNIEINFIDSSNFTYTYSGNTVSGTYSLGKQRWKDGIEYGYITYSFNEQMPNSSEGEIFTNKYEIKLETITVKSSGQKISTGRLFFPDYKMDTLLYKMILGDPEYHKQGI